MDENEKQKHHNVLVNVLRMFYGAFKNLKLYNSTHPTSIEGSKRFVSTLADYFTNRFELSVQDVDGMIIIDDDYFIEESLTFYDLLHGLELFGIGRIVFLPGITDQEVISFCLHLQKNVEEVPVESRMFGSGHIKTYAVVEKVETKKRSKASVNLEHAKAIYDEWIGLTEGIYSKIIEEQSLGGADLSHALDKLIDATHQIPESFAMIIATAPVTKLHAQHGVNTMIQSIFLGHQVGYDIASIKILALAALLHDIGRILLPTDFTTGTKISSSDAEFIHLHARDGASLLTGVQGVAFAIIRVALEHHMGFDDLGYPRMTDNQKVHPFSRIVAIADFLSWGTVSDNVYHRPVAMHRRIRSLMRRAGTQFDPTLVKLLLPFFGIYPTGTKVRMQSGELALSLQPSLANATRPTAVFQQADGGFTAQHLARLADDQINFPRVIKSFSGSQKNISSLTEIIPDENPDSV